MKFDLNDLEAAVQKGIITKDQLNNLKKDKISPSSTTSAPFDMVHVAYYMGALLVIGGMGWFMTEAWEQFGGYGLSGIGLIYALCFILAGRNLWFKKQMKIPGGLLFTMAVCMTPLIIYGLQRATGIWAFSDPGIYRDFHIWIKGGWFFMELGTIIAAIITLRFIKFPFLMAPLAFALWYMSMDIVPILTSQIYPTWDDREIISLIFGLIMLGSGYFIDRRTKNDFAGWLYIFGAIAFWGGLTFLNTESEFFKFIYFLINIFLIFLSVWLDRKVFIVFGSLGCMGYLGSLSHRIFNNSILFPFVLTLIGVFIIFLAVQYQRNQNKFNENINNLLPAEIKKLLPRFRKHVS